MLTFSRPKAHTQSKNYCLLRTYNPLAPPHLSRMLVATTDSKPAYAVLKIGRIHTENLIWLTLETHCGNFLSRTLPRLPPVRQSRNRDTSTPKNCLVGVVPNNTLLLKRDASTLGNRLLVIVTGPKNKNYKNFFRRGKKIYIFLEPFRRLYAVHFRLTLLMKLWNYEVRKTEDLR